jgi:uncharacterized membrane protein
MNRMISTPAKRLPITSRIALLSAFGRQVLSVLLVLACMLNGALAQAQGKAPVEDRTPNRDALLDGQQRLDFARQYWRRAADDAGRAQAEAAEQSRELANAQKRVNELRLLNEQAQKRLATARANEAAAKKAYDSENAAFERRVTPEPQQPQ